MSANNFFSKYFPTPNILNRPSVGIDISPLSIRMMEIIEQPYLKIGKYKESSLKNPFMVGDTGETEAKTILRQWKDDYGLEYVKASLPEEKAYLFDTEVEFGTDSSMRSAIEFSLEENVPLNGSEVIFDYRLIGESDKEGFVKVAVTVLPLEVVNSYINFFQDCGLKPLSFLIEAQGLSRALIKRGDHGTYLIVNIHSTKTAVFIISKGAVQFTSTVSVGCVDFTKALEKQFSISPLEAEKLKETKGFTRSHGDETLAALIGPGSVFRQEIEKVYVYWNKHRSSVDSTEVIQKIILSGKESLTLGFKEYLNQTLNIPTEIGNVWSNMPPFNEYVPPIQFSTALNFGTAIGLALPEKE